MHRIDTPSAQIDKFGAGKNGFTRGNPQTGVPATALDDDYFDAIQEEMAGIVEAAGITLDKTNRDQVLVALKKLFLQSGNNLSEIKDAGLAAVAQTLTNLGLGDVVHLPQLTGIVGTSRNAKMSIAAASATATFTADELIVQTALGGLQYKLSSFSKTINLATTGAGGMDIGTVPVTGFVALYAIYNPTTQVSALLAVNATSVRATEVYTGANMPAGYTASALVSVSPISSSQFKPSYLVGRDVSFQTIQVVSASATMPALIRTSIASAAPLNTLSVRGNFTAGGASSAAASYASMVVAMDVIGCGRQEVRLGVYAPNGSDCGGTFSLNITDPQGIYYRFDTDMTSRSGTVSIVSYSF